MPGKYVKKNKLIEMLKKDKKKTLIVAVSVFIILAGLIYIFKLNYNFVKQAQNGQTGQPNAMTNGSGQPDAGKPASTLLPELKRKIETGQEVRDPFNVPLKLKGIINGGTGGDLAIIEAGNTSYIVKVGEELQGGWKVKEIKKDIVILASGNQTLELKFNGRVNMKINNDQNAAGQEQNVNNQSTTDQKQSVNGQGGDGN